MKASLLTLFACFFIGIQAQSQNKPLVDKNPYFVLSAFIPNQGKLESETLTELLKTKMTQISSSNGFGGVDVASRLVLVPKINLTQFENTPSAPAKVLAKMEVVLSIADATSRVIFKTESFPVVGVGLNEQDAYMKGIQSLATKSEAMSTFLIEGKKKIVDFYTGNCPRVMKEINALVETQQFDSALDELLSVPPEAGDCYNQSMALLPSVFKQRQEFNCGKILQRAEAEIAAGNEEQAAYFLGQIPPGTKCAEESKKTIKKLSDQYMTKYNAQLSLQKDILRFVKEWALTEASNRPRIYTLGGMF